MGESSPDVAQLLLHLPHSLEISGTVEGVALPQHEFDEVSRNVTPGDVETSHALLQNVTLVYWDDVGNTVPRVDDHSRLKT